MKWSFLPANKNENSTLTTASIWCEGVIWLSVYYYLSVLDFSFILTQADKPHIQVFGKMKFHILF